MKVAEVSGVDCEMAANLIKLVQAGEWTMQGREFGKAGDCIRWLQNLAVEMAHVFHGSKTEASADSSPVAAAPASPAGSAFTVKSYSPGKSKK